MDAGITDSSQQVPSQKCITVPVNGGRVDQLLPTGRKAVSTDGKILYQDKKGERT
jgi:hypothetical protein